MYNLIAPIILELLAEEEHESQTKEERNHVKSNTGRNVR